MHGCAGASRGQKRASDAIELEEEFEAQHGHWEVSQDHLKNSESCPSLSLPHSPSVKVLQLPLKLRKESYVQKCLSLSSHSRGFTEDRDLGSSFLFPKHL